MNSCNIQNNNILNKTSNYNNSSNNWPNSKQSTEKIDLNSANKVFEIFDPDENSKIEELSFQQIEEREVIKLSIPFFKYTNVNLEKINHCIQNVNWIEINKNREDLIRHYEIHQEGNRNNPEITVEEKKEKKDFHLEKDSDIFYTFSEYFLNAEPIYNHFQLRKNIIFISEKEVVYFNLKGVELFNIVNNQKFQLVYFSQQESDFKVLCFDAFKEMTHENKKEFVVHLVFGKFNNRILIQKVKVYEKLKKKISQIMYSQEYLISEEPEQNQLINFVKFSDNKRYIYTSCNDAYMKIFDYENNMLEVARHKGKSCVNHFSFNHSQNIIAAVGDYEEVHLVDPKSSKTISYLKGHYDFGFVAKFQPFSDHILASGNQDYSAKIWDLRKISENAGENKKSRLYNPSDFNFNKKLVNQEANKKRNSEFYSHLQEVMAKNDNHISEKNTACLKTYFGISNSIGDLKFVENDFLVMLENTYNVHVVNLKENKIQSIKYIGQSIGMDYCENTHKLYFGVFQHSFSGIYAFKKISNFLDVMEYQDLDFKNKNEIIFDNYIESSGHHPIP